MTKVQQLIQQSEINRMAHEQEVKEASKRTRIANTFYLVAFVGVSVFMYFALVSA